MTHQSELETRGGGRTLFFFVSVAVDGDSWKAGGRGSAWPTPRPTARSTRAGYLCCVFCALPRCRGPSSRSPGGTRYSLVAGATRPARSSVHKLRASVAVTHSYRLRPLFSFLRAVPPQNPHLRSPGG